MRCEITVRCVGSAAEYCVLQVFNADGKRIAIHTGKRAYIDRVAQRYRY